MVLAVFAGLPGVGKSTLAARVAETLPAAVLAVDTVDFTLQRYDVTEPRPGFAAYGVVAALAEVQLRMGHHVIIDAVNPVKAARQMWTTYLDWGLADFSGYIAADELYDGRFASCPSSITAPSSGCSTRYSTTTPTTPTSGHSCTASGWRCGCGA